MAKIKCYLCSQNATSDRDRQGRDAFEVDCSICGKYVITDYVLKTNMLNDKNKKSLIEKIKSHDGDKLFFITADKLGNL